MSELQLLAGLLGAALAVVVVVVAYAVGVQLPTSRVDSLVRRNRRNSRRVIRKARRDMRRAKGVQS